MESLAVFKKRHQATFGVFKLKSGQITIFKNKKVFKRKKEKKSSKSNCSDDNLLHFVEKKQKQPPEVFYKKGVPKISKKSQENTCTRVSFLINFQTCGQRWT